MRRPRLSDAENRIRQTTWAFAKGRLQDVAVLEWAMTLGSDQQAERTSLRELFDQNLKSVREPFALAWRCIFEYWQRPDVETNHDKFLISQELKHGGTQRETIRLIVECVRPWLKVETAKRFSALSGEKIPKNPKHLKHLLWATISSGDRLTPQDIGLHEINDRNFLLELATALNTALLSGLNLARMIGSISEDMDITNWQVHRVYYVPSSQYLEGGGEPDRHSQGFAPAAKLMFAVTEKISSIDMEAAKRVVSSWDTGGWKLYRRLWAAAARTSELVDPSQVSAFLEGISDAEFWRTGSYPEIAEVRAMRWNSFSPDSAVRLEQRLLSGEPFKLLRNSVDKAEIPQYKMRKTLIELKRIQSAGGNLSGKATAWIQKASNEIENPPVIDITYEFNKGVRVLYRGRTVVQTFDEITTSKLLDELAKSLSDTGWDDKSENASDFIGQNASLILDLLEKNSDLNVAIKIWRALGYSFRPSDLNVGPDNASADDQSKIPIAARACRAIASERSLVLNKAIDGLASFMTSWDRLLKNHGEFPTAWLKLWPFAVERTNEFEQHASPLSDRAYSSSVGQLLFALFAICPTIKGGESPMTQGIWPNILTALENTTGEARVHMQYVLLRDVGYFYTAAPNWAAKNLLEPLKQADPNAAEGLDLWEGFASSRLPEREIMTQLTQPIIAAAISSKVSAKVRADLAELVVCSILIDRRDAKEPVVSPFLAQQMLRMGGDDVRRQSVDTLKEFLEEDEKLDIQSRFELVRTVFLEVWPKELTLSSRAVSAVLARFPAAAGVFYDKAAELVLPYITPFDCWSLWEYGVLDPNKESEKFRLIDSPAKASAFLSILDKTVGGEEGAIIPNGLEDALLHVARVEPKLEKDVRFQRLITLSRR